MLDPGVRGITGASFFNHQNMKLALITIGKKGGCYDGKGYDQEAYKRG